MSRFMSQTTAHCAPLPWAHPFRMERKRKGRKTALKWRRIPFRGKFFLRRQAARRGGGCTARASYMWARRSCIFQPFFTPIKVPSLVFYTGSFYGRIEQQMHVGTKWENNSRIIMILPLFDPIWHIYYSRTVYFSSNIFKISPLKVS